MADGKVVIDVVLSDGQVVKGVANIDKSLGGVDRSAQKGAFSIKKMVTTLGLVALASKAIDMVKNSLDGAISRYDTLNNFPKVMQQIGFSAEDSQKAIDRLSDGIQGLPTTLDSVAGTAQRIAVMTGDLEGATETTLALNNAFIASGASSADAERGLEQYVQMLSKGQVDLESWRSLQETMGVALNDTAKAFGFTGKSAQNDLYDALKKGEITFEEFNGKIIELSNTQNGFADRARTASGGIKTAYTNMKTAVVRGVTTIIESIDNMLKDTSFKSIENILSTIGTKFNEVLVKIAQSIPTIVQKIMEVKTALEPWMPLIISLGSAVGTFILITNAVNMARNAFMAARTAVMIFNATVMANPYVLIISIIVGLAVLIYKYWDQIKAFTIKTWTAIKVSTTAIWNSIKSFFAKTWNAIKAIFNAGLKVLDSKTSGAFSAYFSTIKAYMQMIWGIIKDIWDFIKASFQNALALVKAIVNGDFQGMKNAINAQMKNIWSLISNIWGRIKTYFGSVLQAIWSVVGARFIAIVNSIRQKMNQAKATVQAILRAIVSVFKSVNLVTYGKNMIQGLVNGIKGMAGAVKNAVTNIVSGIKNKIKSALSIHSPSRWMRDEVGKQIGAGLAQGIDKSTATVSKSAKKQAEAAKKAANEAIKNLELKYDTKKISASKYIAELKKIQKSYKLTGDQARKVQREIHSANQAMKKQRASAQKQTASTNRKKASEKIKNLELKYDTGKISASTYISELKKVQKQYKLTGDQARKVKKEIYSANQSIKKQAEEHKKSLKKINDGVKKSNDNYLKKVKSINDKLAKDIKKAQDDYKKKLADRTQSIYSQTGLFDAVESKKVDGSQLLKNLQGQNKQFKDWQGNLTKLENAGVSKKFIDELRDMGVGAADEVQAIANMPKSMLDDYVKAWSEKHKLAKNEATKQMADEKANMQKQIKQLKDAAKVELDKAKADWRANLAKFSEETKKLGTFKNSGKVLGKNTVAGIIKGFKTMKGPLANETKKLAKTIEKEVKKALKIKSPSRLMRDEVGKMITAGITKGIDSDKKSLAKSASEMAGLLTPDVSKANFVNRLRGVTAPLGNLLPGGGAYAGQTTTQNILSSSYDDGEVKTLLRQIADKDSSLYMDKQKVGGIMDREQARRTGLVGRRVAID